ncbi:carboxyl transferase domain-containing protein [Streptomyces sp. NPDC048277]|uniref:carboxyl transferase domain-containing protein n=1 Tax=Streptomyces sp. NPDC048277 TaxID=3155027 RepID=UPI0034081A57
MSASPAEDPVMSASSADAMTILERFDLDLASSDPLRFPGYAEQLDRVGAESVDTRLVDFGGAKAVVIECRFDRHGGTMGMVAGERIARAYRRATDLRTPVINLIATGGARLQEGMLSLIQMARTTDARAAHASAGLLSVGVLRSPTTGGVFASWGSQLDLRAARREATVGFGGPLVVEQVTGQLPPPISHTAEAAYAHGMVDALLDGPDERHWISAALGHTDTPLRLRRTGPRSYEPFATAVPRDAWQAVRRVRRPERPSGLEWAAALTDSWVELRGPDPVIRAGLARMGDIRLVVIAMDRHARPGGARPGPADYRTAQRAIALAGRLGLPLLTLIDTPGAEPGPDAEADDIAGEIARTLRAMSDLTSVSAAVCVGEGGSGGAMALAHADRLFLLGDAVFSVIGPEAAAVILRRDAARAADMARSLGIRAWDLRCLGLVDGLIDVHSPRLVDDLRGRVVDALTTAAVGDRSRRLDTATAGRLRTL